MYWETKRHRAHVIFESAVSSLTSDNHQCMYLITSDFGSPRLIMMSSVTSASRRARHVILPVRTIIPASITACQVITILTSTHIGMSTAYCQRNVPKRNVDTTLLFRFKILNNFRLQFYRYIRNIKI